MSDTQFNKHVAIDTTPMPDHIPKVPEIGSTSAPLLSASFFIGARCRPYNDDFMQCKTEAYGKGEFDCMKEGRKVTRCAASVLQDINNQCLQPFRDHWNCLENRNHQLYQCRRAERALNQCVFDKIGLRKEIPDTPPDETPVHLRKKQIYATLPQGDLEDRWTYRMQAREQEQIQYHVDKAIKELEDMKNMTRTKEPAAKADSNGGAPS